LDVTHIVAQQGDSNSAEVIRSTLNVGEVRVESTGNLSSDITIGSRLAPKQNSKPFTKPPEIEPIPFQGWVADIHLQEPSCKIELTNSELHPADNAPCLLGE